MKAVFLKSPSRVCAFKEQLPGVPLPPEPIVTRWGTWLKAVEYYSTNFAGLVINGFPADDSVSVRKAQDVLCEDTLEGDLAYLCSNFTFLADTIKSLESAGETLARNIGLILNVQERVDAVPAGPAAVQVRSKLQSVLSKNSGFSVLKEVSKVLTGEHSRVPEGVEALNIPKYKYVRPTHIS